METKKNNSENVLDDINSSGITPEEATDIIKAIDAALEVVAEGRFEAATHKLSLLKKQESGCTCPPCQKLLKEVGQEKYDRAIAHDLTIVETNLKHYNGHYTRLQSAHRKISLLTIKN